MTLFNDLSIALKPETTSTQKSDYYFIELDGITFNVGFKYDGINRFGEPLFFERNGIDYKGNEWDENLSMLAQDILYDKAYRALKEELIANKF